MAQAADAMATVAAQCESPELDGRYGLDGPLALTALGYQVRALADLSRFAEAETAIATCRARAARMPGNMFAEILVGVAEGWLLYRSGSYGRAVISLRHALDSAIRAEAYLMRPVAEGFLGAAMIALGQSTEGKAHLHRAIAYADTIGLGVQQGLRRALLASANKQ